MKNKKVVRIKCKQNFKIKWDEQKEKNEQQLKLSRQKMKKKRITKLIRLSKSLHDKLKDEAKIQRSTLSKLIDKIVIGFFRKQK